MYQLKINLKISIQIKKKKIKFSAEENKNNEFTYFFVSFDKDNSSYADFTSGSPLFTDFSGRLVS